MLQKLGGQTFSYLSMSVVCVSFCVKVRHNFYPVVVGGGDVRVYMCEQQLQYSTALSKPLSQSSSSPVTPADKETSVLLPSSVSASHGNLPFLSMSYISL